MSEGIVQAGPHFEESPEPQHRFFAPRRHKRSATLDGFRVLRPRSLFTQQDIG